MKVDVKLGYKVQSEAWSQNKWVFGFYTEKCRCDNQSDRHWI